MQGHWYFEPLVVIGFSVERRHGANSWIGLNPFSFASVSDNMNTAGSDGEVSWQQILFIHFPNCGLVANGAGVIAVSFA